MKNLFNLFLLAALILVVNACGNDDQIMPNPTPEPEPELEPEELDLPAAGLLVYMNFNDNVDDQSGNEHHGILHGGEYTEDRDGAKEGAYHLEMGDYIQLPKNHELGLGGSTPYSMGAYVKLGSLLEDGRSMIMSKFNGGVLAGWYLGVDDDATIWAYRNSAPWAVFTDTKIDLDKYYHLMSTFDGSVLRIYIDGEEIRASAPWSSHPNDTQTPTLIGAAHSQNEVVATFHGDIDDLVIYNRALTETEIKNMVED